MKNFIKWTQKRTIFDAIAVGILIFGVVFLATIILKKESWVDVVVRVTPVGWGWNFQDPPYWLVDKISVGETQYDTLGKKIAEVVGVTSYETNSDRKSTYLNLRLKVTFNRRNNKMVFNHRPLDIGKSIDLEFERIGFEGLVEDIPGVVDERRWGDRIVEIVVNDFTGVFPETLGIFPWRADAITKGDKLIDSRKQVIGEVLDIVTKPSRKTVITSTGEVRQVSDPFKKEVIMKIKLKVFNQNGVDYFLYDNKVKVGSLIPLIFPKVDIVGEISRIIE